MPPVQAPHFLSALSVAYYSSQLTETKLDEFGCVLLLEDCSLVCLVELVVKRQVLGLAQTAALPRGFVGLLRALLE